LELLIAATSFLVCHV